MGDVSLHFDRSEFSCKCGCGFSAVDVQLLGILERIREHFKKPVNITNVCRCLAHNREVGSEDTSQHVRGMAADIWIEGVEPETIAHYVDDYLLITKGGIGIYDTFVHIDIKEGNMRRWNNRGMV